MTVDYDAPRSAPVDADESPNEITVRRTKSSRAAVDVDEIDVADSYELPGADLFDLSDEELIVRVVPKQPDEFTCSSCFLVHHRSRLARGHNGNAICNDCA